MRISLDIVIDEIGSDRLIRRPSYTLRRREVPWITLSCYANEHSLENGWLNISDEHEALSFLRAHGSVLVLCCCSSDRIPDGLLSFEKQVLFVREDDARSMYLLLRDYFSELSRWIENLRELSYNEADYTSYLSSSESVIGNYITMSDSAFKLIAHTPGLHTDDPVTNTLVKTGFHSPETVSTFKKLQLPEQWRNETPFLETVEDSPICRYPTVAHIFKFKKNYFFHIVMLCDKRPMTDGLLDLFAILVHELEPRVKEEWLRRDGFSQPHDEFLHNLLSGKAGNSMELVEQAENLGIPLEADFLLACITLPNEDAISIESVAWRLVQQLYSCLVTIYKGSIVIVRIGRNKEGPDTDGFSSLQSSFLSAFSVNVGESNPFEELTDIRYAYQQAHTAIRYAQLADKTLYSSVAAADRPSTSLNYYRFGDVFLNYLIFAQERDLPFLQYCLSQHPLSKIIADDRKNHSEKAKILLTYITSDRKATSAAHELHMHRNSIVYHVEQIEKKYHVDLMNPHTRLEFQLVAHYLHKKPLSDA